MTNAIADWLRPEYQLLLCCARTQLTPVAAARRDRLLEGALDWPLVLQLARQQRVLPLLYWNVRRHASGAVPIDALLELRRSFYATSGHHSVLAAALLRLLEQLAAWDIAAVPFKGPVLAAALYPSPELRVSSDLDLLVRRDQVAAAGALLRDAGYRPVFEHGRLREFASRPFRHAMNFVSADRRYSVDLHWKLSQPYFAFALGQHELRARLQPVALGGRAVPTLAPEDLLLVLCMHGARHAWARLAWVADIAELIRVYPQLQWQAVIGTAQQLGSARMLAVGLYLARALLEAPVPADVCDWIEADSLAELLAAQAAGWMFRELTPPLELAQALWYAQVRERWGDKLRFGPELARVLLSLARRGFGGMRD